MKYEERNKYSTNELCNKRTCYVYETRLIMSICNKIKKY